MLRPLVALALLVLLGLEPIARAEHAATPPTLRQRSSAWLARVRERMKLPETIARPLRLGLCRARGSCTLVADRLEAKLPAGAARLFHKVRLASPLALVGFVGKKVAEDPIFLSSLGVASTVVQHLEIPALIALGVNPALALAVHELTETPVNLALICWRQHHLREDRSQSFLGTLRGLGREYRAFAETRREENRRFMASRAGARPGSLPSLAASLP